MANGKKRGFGSMNKDLQRAIARKGGKAVQASGNAHRWNKETARAAGKLGGRRPRRRAA